MGELCLVISGEWRFSHKGRWNFDIDKTRMSRVVAVREDMSILELKDTILREFFQTSHGGVTTSLSYWPPNTTELATGITTPPVLVTNTGGISFFLKHFRVNRKMNMFVSFGAEVECTLKAPDIQTTTMYQPKHRDLEYEEGSGSAPSTIKTGSSVGLQNNTVAGFKTPTPAVKRKFGTEGYSGSNTEGFSRKESSYHDFSAGSTNIPFDLDDEFILKKVQEVEEKFFRERLPKKSSASTEETEDSEYDDYCGAMPDGCDVRPVGYDMDFWEPLIDDALAGSDAADIMCPVSEGFDGKATAMGMQREYMCFTNDAFDHSVAPAGTLKEDGDSKVHAFSPNRGEAYTGGTEPPPNSWSDIAGPENREWTEPTMDPWMGSTGQTTGEWTARNGHSNNVPWIGSTGHPHGEWTTSPGHTDNDAVSPPVGGPLFPTHTSFFPPGFSPHPPNETRTPAAVAQPRSCRDAQSNLNMGSLGLSLDQIDDEEFDLPPMFDDTLYVTDDIPDLDIDQVDEGIHVGKIFGSKKECRIALAIYAIKGMFTFRQSRTKRYYFVLSCTDDLCHWRVLAREVGGCGYYEIKKAELEHTCCQDTRNAYKKKASSRVIAAVFKAKYGDPEHGPRAGQLQQMVLEDLRVNSSYMQCYRAKAQAVDEIRGSDEDSYSNLLVHLHMLKLANPGTIADLETEEDESGIQRFLYVFLAFGASIAGLRKLRPTIVLDGTHLWGKYKGVLLTACGQDANFQVFPIAYAVVDGENNESWIWFLQKLERILADSPILTFISDRHKSIYAGLKAVYPKAKHGCCIVHLARNAASRFHNKGLRKLVITAAFAYRVSAFKLVYDKIRSINGACAKYLEEIGMAHWTRVYCGGQHFNIMTSNACEQLNKALKKGRGSPIIELLTFIQEMMTRWFNARRKKSLKHRGKVSIEVEKLMTKHTKEVKGSKLIDITDWSCQIVGIFGEKNKVSLADKTCSCKKYNRLQIPCGHALLAADSLGLPYSSLVGHEYRVATWQETYRGVINPTENSNDVDLPPHVTKVVLFPPRSRRGTGRCKEIRYPSVGEIPVTRVKKLIPNKCTKCFQPGHNRSSCSKQT